MQPTEEPEFGSLDGLPEAEASPDTAAPIDTRPEVTRRDFGRLAASFLALTGLGGMSPSALANDPQGERQENSEADARLAEALFNDEVANLYPSGANIASMVGLAGWFGTAAARGFMPKSWQKFTARDNKLAHKLGTFSVPSGLAMFATEVGVRMPLLQFGNDYDRANLHHESDEVFNNIYLVFLMSYLAHFAEQGIQVSPEADDMLKEFFSGFNLISGGWQLDESQERPNETADSEKWKEHMEKAERDMIKATTDMLSYSAATAALIFPTVYGTSAFSQGVERKYLVVSFEYFLAKAHLEGKTGEVAQAEAMKAANAAYEEFFSFKLAFVDNILAGLGVDGPCIPVFIKLYEANGWEGVGNYYKMMLPNIAKYTAVGMEQLLAHTIGPGATARNQARIVAQAVGETILNGVTINVRILCEMAKQPFVDNGLDRSASFVQDVLARPNGEEIIQSVERHMAKRGNQIFSFDPHVLDFGVQLKDWFVGEVVGGLAHPGASMEDNGHYASRERQERELIQHLHAILLERYGMVLLWDSHDTDKKRGVIEALLKDDPVLKAHYGSTDVNELMEDRSFRAFIATHFNNVLDSKSPLFQSLIFKGEVNQYPALECDDYPHVIRQAIRSFVQSLGLEKTHVDSHYHPEAGEEVFGALSGQLIGAAIASSMAQWMLAEGVDMGPLTRDLMKQSFVMTFGGAETEDLEVKSGYPLLDFTDKLLGQVNFERGELSGFAVAKVEGLKGELKVAIDDFHAHAATDQKDEKIAAMVEKFTQIVVSIFQIPRTSELKSSLLKIYGVGATMTPIADNIAAVLFVIASSFQTMDSTYGEDVLRQYIKISVIPGLPLKVQMTVQEALIDLAAMVGINLGNGTLWGNGVQLGEKRRVITKVNSRNIGDLSVERPSPTATPGKYTALSNRYARIADAWTLADVYALLDQLVEAIVNDKNPVYAPKHEDVAPETPEHH